MPIQTIEIDIGCERIRVPASNLVYSNREASLTQFTMLVKRDQKITVNVEGGAVVEAVCCVEPYDTELLVRAPEEFDPWLANTRNAKAYLQATVGWAKVGDGYEIKQIYCQCFVSVVIPTPSGTFIRFKTLAHLAPTVENAILVLEQLAGKV